MSPSLLTTLLRSPPNLLMLPSFIPPACLQLLPLDVRLLKVYTFFFVAVGPQVGPKERKAN